MNNAANWDGSFVPVNDGGEILYFGEANQYTAYNDIASPWQLRNIVFGADAGASYTLYGDSLWMNGAFGDNATKNIIQNLSAYQQVIENNFYFTTQTWFMTFDTGASGIRWSGSVEADTGTNSFTLLKLGSGNLVVGGSTVMEEPDPENPLGVKTFDWWVLDGTLVMDASSPNFASNSGIVLSINNHSNGNLKIIGSDTGETTVNLAILGTLSANRAHWITVDSNGGEGTTLSFANWEAGHSATPGTSYPAREAASLHFDLSSGNSTVTFSDLSPSPYANGIIRIALVTDNEGTGFATIGDNNSIVRYTGYSALPVSGSSSFDNYQVTGSLELASDWIPVYSLSIKGAGALSSASADSVLNVTGALLMEPGVGDYAINTSYFSAVSGSLRVYQLSTEGVLTISGHLGVPAGSYQGSTFSVTGPGTVRLTGEGVVGDSNNPELPKGYTIAGGYYVASGRLEINSLGANTAQYVEVTDGTLAGNGQIGGGIYWGWTGSNANLGTNYATVRIFYGGTIDASNHEDKALSIHGQLLLESGATYHMILGADAKESLSVMFSEADAYVSLAGDLSLVLDYAPVLNEWIILLTTDGVINGEFLTVNGHAFTGDNGNEFSLLYQNTYLYEFMIHYDYDLGDGVIAVALQVQAIPEPSIVALLAGLALVGATWRRYRWKK